MKALILLICFSLFIQLQARSNTGSDASKITSATISDDHTAFNINKWLYWQSNDGISAHDPFTGGAGGIYPINMAPVIYADGLVIGANLDVNDMPIRVGGRTYRTGMIPGNINNDPNSQKIYRIRPDWKTLTFFDLINDAAILNNISQADVTQDMTQELYDRYASDWKNWPVDLGAPYVDVNENGIYDPVLDADGYPDAAQGDYPGIKDANQVIWYVMNDNDASKTVALYGSNPIGFELQITVWSLNHAPFADVIFKKFRLKYHGQAHVNEMRIGYWGDFDIGDYSDDLVGCDPQLNLGYTYSANPTDELFAPFSVPPPAAGFMFVPELSTNPNVQQLHSFGYFSAGGAWYDPMLGVYDGTLSWFNLLRGYLPTTNIDSPTPFKYNSGPYSGQSTFFPLDGDPEMDPNAMQGDIDGMGQNMNPGDRRLVVTLPAFEMDPGDEVEFTFAILGKMGQTNINSVTRLKELASAVRNELQKPHSVQLVKNQVQIDDNSAVAQINFQFKIDDPSSGVASASLIFNAKDSNPFERALYNDGTNGDEIAGDSIWSFAGFIQTQKYPVSIDLKLQINAGDEVLFPGIIEGLSLRPAPELQHFRIVWENGKQDQKLNHGETAKIAFTLVNKDIIFDIDAITLRMNNFQQAFETQVPAGQSDSTSLYLIVTAPDTGHVYQDIIAITYDGNYALDTLTLALETWEPTSLWGDTLEISNISGLAKNVFPIVADPSLLNDHQYQLSFHYQDSVNQTDLRWNLKDLTTDEDKLVDQPVPEEQQTTNPVIDGIQWVVYSPPPGLEAIVQVSDAQGPLTPDEFDGYGAPYGGNNVWHSLSSPNDANRFYISAGGANGDLYRIERSILNANNHDFELRFTDQDTSVFLWWYDGNQWAYVPFEFWDVGITYDDYTDDVRLLTGGYSGGATPGDFDFGYTDPYSNFPATDWIYARKPLNAQGAYSAFVNDVTSNTLNYSWWDNSLEVLARITICDFGGAGTLPEAGTIIRFITKKVFTPTDTILVVASATDINTSLAIPLTFQLKQNYPNPFNPQTTIEFSLPQHERVRLEIYNILGQVVRTLVNDELSAGNHRFVWDGRNEQGQVAPSGIYIYRLKTPERSMTKRMVLIR
ncbi:FlgD immunoglobulin-like domain containing protein [Caldithrix abyssi]